VVLASAPASLRAFIAGCRALARYANAAPSLLTIGFVGALFTPVTIVLPQHPVTFAWVPFAGENNVRIACRVGRDAIIFDTIGT